jgi:4-amino-4-deoxy-L-arabinose transferase-like glycosyltransferase
MKLRQKKYEFGLCLFLFFLCGFVLFQNWYWPVTDWDALALYDFRAKVITLRGSMIEGKTLEYFFQYPLYTSLLHVATYLSGLKEAKIWYAIIYQSFLVTFYALVRKRTSRMIALLAAVALAISPELFTQSFMAYTNLSFAAFTTTGFLYLWQWYQDGQDKHLLLGAILIGLSTWVRMSEPFYLVSIVIIFLGTLKYKRAYALSVLAALIAVFTRYPWDKYITLLYGKGPPTPLNQITLGSSLSFPFLLHRLGEVSVYVWQYSYSMLFSYAVLGTIVLIYDIRQKKYRLLLPWLTLFLFVGMIFAGTLMLSFSLESWNRIGDSLARMTSSLLPLFIFCLFIGQIWQEKGKKP